MPLWLDTHASRPAGESPAWHWPSTAALSRRDLRLLYCHSSGARSSSSTAAARASVDGGCARCGCGPPATQPARPGYTVSIGQYTVQPTTTAKLWNLYWRRRQLGFNFWRQKIAWTRRVCALRFEPRTACAARLRLVPPPRDRAPSSSRLGRRGVFWRQRPAKPGVFGAKEQQASSRGGAPRAAARGQRKGLWCGWDPGATVQCFSRRRDRRAGPRHHRPLAPPRRRGPRRPRYRDPHT